MNLAMPSIKSDRVTDDASGKGAWVGLALLLVYSIARNLLHSASKPFWFDEMYTWGLAHQPGASAIWRLLEHGADSNPPGFYLIEWVSSRLVPNQEIALRLPSVLGFCVLVTCLFVFVRKRAGNTVALCCAAVPLVTVLFDTYAVEARPYVLLVACISFAMVCYQHAPSHPWMGLMALGLAVSQTVHYYTVFAMIPFAIAEFAVWLRSRRVRWGVWLALIGGFLPFLRCWPLLREFGKINRSHFWAKPSLLDAGSVYGWFINAPPALGFGVAAFCAFGVVAAMISNSGDEEAISTSERAPFQEYVLALSLIALPFIVYVATRIAHSGMAHRYSLPAILGILVAAGYILPRSGRRSVALYAVLIGFALLFQEARFWHSELGSGKMVSPATALERMVNSTGYGDLAVVVSDGLDYAPIAHYASPESARRFMALVDVPAAIEFCGSDSVDQGLLGLPLYLPLQVYEFSSFAPSHPTFLLYSTHQSQFDWWPSRFIRDGDSLTVLSVEGDSRLYLVKLAAKKEAPKRD
jgi:Dolichyl-phosphate-mannose-protein mannosyltransferase